MNKIKLPKEDRDKWLEALRSGKYKQGKYSLLMENENNENTYCCLGVYCDLKGITLSHNAYSLPINAISDESILPVALIGEWDDDVYTDIIDDEFDLENDISEEIFTSVLATLNDVKDQTFDEIADYIEQVTMGV